MIRRYGERVISGQRYRWRPGAYAILLMGDDVLLTLQDGEEFDLQLPGGGIDPGEHAIPALHREVREETGWGMQLSRRLGAFRRFTFMPDYQIWAEKLCHIYLGQPTRNYGPPSEPGHSEVWMPAADAAQLLSNAGDRAFMAQVLEGRR